MIQAEFDKTFEGWRDAARQFLLQNVRPETIQWGDENLSLFTDNSKIPFPTKKNVESRVPRAFVELAENVCYARDEDRFDLLYRILYRLKHENSVLLEISVDPDIHRAFSLAQSVKKDIHKMHAFVRFKKVIVGEEETYTAWHKAEHFSLKLGSPFFVRRFGDKRWSIFTPDESAHWDLHNLTFGPGLEQNAFNAKDDWDDVWKTYYKSIFNPSRIKIKMMKSEMATKYWQGLPEASLIQQMVREAPERLQKMALNHNVAAEVSNDLDLKSLKNEIQSCKSCPLYAKASNVVFGEGPERADIMIVGEQPGDQEDLAGRPFVGPSGDVLNHALGVAKLSRQKIYLTNAVKHFKWTPKGKFRLHQKPSGSEMHACKPWLEAEIAKVKPKIIVALGATAATAVLGRLPKISEERGKILRGSPFAEAVIVSWHPSAILRSSNDAEATERKDQLAADLELARKSLKI